MSSSSAVTTSASGGTSINVASIVSQLMATEQQPLNNLTMQQTSYQAQISAYGTVQSALSTFQTAMAGLSNVSQFQGVTAASSNTAALTASTTNTVAPGTYTVNVSTLAQAQSLVAGGVASQTAAIGTGAATTLTFDLGTITGNTLNATTGKYGTTLSATTTSGSTTITAPTANLAVGAAISGAGIPVGATITSITDANNFVISAPATATGTAVALQAGATFTSNGNGAKTVTIDSTNNSLQGIAAAINAANVGVTASIINDGSANPYRLSLSSSTSGSSNSIKISVAGDAALSSLLAEDPTNAAGQNLTQTTAAQNANLTVNGVAVTSSTNTVSSAVQGLTLNLLQTSTTPISLTLAPNTSAATTAINSFVSAYNAVEKAVFNVTAYNPTTKTPAILQGDFAVNTVRNQLRQILNTPIVGAGSLTTLMGIGVGFQKDGTMAVDSTKLNAALSSNFNDVAALFGTVGHSSDPQISFGSAPSTVQAGNYAVNISQLATQGKVTGSAAAGTTTIAAGVNDTLNLSLNGTSATVTLAPGAYTAASLAAEVQTQINGASALSAAGASVAVTQTGGIFTITSNSYGSTSNVSIAGNGASNLLGGAPVSTAGLDVAGTIAGLAATGSGQFLTAAGGNALGLKIQISGGALGARGTFNYSQGVVGILSQWATTQQGNNGLVSSATTGVNSSLKTIANQITAENQRLVAIQAQYTKQYTALDGVLSRLNSTQQYLTQQLASLPNAPKSN